MSPDSAQIGLDQPWRATEEALVLVLYQQSGGGTCGLLAKALDLWREKWRVTSSGIFETCSARLYLMSTMCHLSSSPFSNPGGWSYHPYLAKQKSDTPRRLVTCPEPEPGVPDFQAPAHSLPTYEVGLVWTQQAGRSPWFSQAVGPQVRPLTSWGKVIWDSGYYSRK